MKNIEISNYLKRINLTDCNNDLDGLINLQVNHIEHIPFENLNVIVGRKIDLTIDHLFNKVVKNKRGGYCFELNTLYSNLLTSLGFSSQPVLARVWLRNPAQTPPRTHLAHLIELDGETYITDVGFGGLTTRIPLNINDPNEVNDKDGVIRIAPHGNNQFMVQRQVKGEWANQYSFETVEISFQDIEVANYFTSTNTKSHFCHDNFIGKFTADGRIGLFNNQLSIRKGLEVVEKREISYGPEWLEAIKNSFDLTLDFSEKEFEMLFSKSSD